MRGAFRDAGDGEPSGNGRAPHRRPYGMGDHTGSPLRGRAATWGRPYGLPGKLTVSCSCFLFPRVASDACRYGKRATTRGRPYGLPGKLTVSCSLAWRAMLAHFCLLPVIPEYGIIKLDYCLTKARE